MNMNMPISWAAKRGLKGPWPCEDCGQLSQYTDVSKRINRVFCRNERCRFERIIDKQHGRVIENDGTCWEYDNRGNKRQVTCR
jgi:hypothetical protein